MTSKLFKDLKLIAENVPKVANAQIAAAIVYKRQLISVGFNQKKTHPFQKTFSKNPDAIYLHAETSAIYNALKKVSVEELKKCSLYIFRIKSDGSTGLAKPCVGCMKCITTFDLKAVYYTDENMNHFIKL